MKAKRHAMRGEHLRRALAQEAARLMAEHGIRDFLVAKRKAAERFGVVDGAALLPKNREIDRKSTRLNSSHLVISYAVFCLKKKKAGIVEARGVTSKSATGSMGNYWLMLAKHRA